MKKRKHIIGFDFDQTLTRHPSLLSAFAVSPYVDAYIITGRSIANKDSVIEEMEKLGINRDLFLDIICYPINYSSENWDNTLHQRICEWKAEVCKTLKVDMIFEDSLLIVEPIKRISPHTRISFTI